MAQLPFLLRRSLAIPLLALVATEPACDRSEGGVTPVGGDRSSEVELERFARRLHLDLTARPAADEFLADAVAELGAAAGGQAAARAALAAPLIESAEFAEALVGELSNRVFGGEDPEDRYELLCAITREICCAPTEGDPCADCDCGPVVEYAADRQAVRDAAADLAAGRITTAAVERRFAGSKALSDFSEPSEVVEQLFEIFLGRVPEEDEVMNGEAIARGSLVPGNPAGILFHRHGSNYPDLVDILFESEVYREAATSAVFDRYLGRPAGLAEMAHFAAELDPEDPDIRSIIRAVVSSQEYFEQ